MPKLAKRRVLASLLGLGCMLLSFPVYSGGVVTSVSQAALMSALSGGGTVTFGFNGTIYLTNTITVANNHSPGRHREERDH